MIRSSFILCVVALFFTACVPVISPRSSFTETPKTPTATISKPPAVSYTPTRTPLPALSPAVTRIISPTPTVMSLPSPTITPMMTRQVVSHPLALNESRATGQMKRLARIGQGVLYDVEWSPDGKYLAISTGLGVFLYDAVTLEQIRFVDVNDKATEIAFAPDGNALAVAQDNRISVWNLLTGQKDIEMEGEIAGGIWTLVYGRGYIAAFGQIARGLGEAVPQLKVWYASTGRLMYSKNLIGGWTVAVDINPDGKTIAFWGDDGMALRDIRTGNKLQDIPGHFDVAFSSDGTKLFTSFWDQMDTGKKFAVWMTTLTDGEQLQVLGGTECQYLVVNGGAAICYGSKDVIQFDPASGKLLKTFSFSFELGSVSISPNGQYLAVIESNSVKVVDTQSEQEVKSFDLNSFDSCAIGLIRLNDADYYVTATSDDQGYIQIWNLGSGTVLRRFQVSDTHVVGLAFSPDYLTLASIDAKSIVRLWNISNGVFTHEFDLSAQNVDGPLVFSPDGLRLAMTDKHQENTLELDLQSGFLKQMGGNPSSYVYAYTLTDGWYSYAPDGHLMTWGQNANNVTLEDLSANESVELPYKLESDATFIDAVARSPDGKFFAMGQAGADILVWDLHSRKLVQTLRGHEMRGGDGWIGAIRHLVFNPQGDLLASVGWDGTTRLWSIRTGVQLRELNVCCFAGFSSDGRVLITTGQGVIRVWGVLPWP